MRNTARERGIHRSRGRLIKRRDTALLVAAPWGGARNFGFAPIQRTGLAAGNYKSSINKRNSHPPTATSRWKLQVALRAGV